MKKKIIIISIVIIGIVLLTFILGISLKNIIITALTGGVFAAVLTKENIIKNNGKEIMEGKKKFEKRKKKILFNDYNDIVLATDPANILLHERIKSRRNKKNRS